MRKVLVVLARPLFAPCALAGFAETLATRLKTVDGVDAEVMTIPVGGGAERLLDDAALCGLLRTLNIDRMVALNFPAYLLPFADKTIWLGEGAHPFAEEPASPALGQRAAAVRRMIKAADIEALSRSGPMLCTTEPLRRAMSDWCGAAAEVLPDPSDGDRAWALTLQVLLA